MLIYQRRLGLNAKIVRSAETGLIKPLYRPTGDYGVKNYICDQCAKEF